MNFFINLIKSIVGGDGNKYESLSQLCNIVGFFLKNSDSDGKGVDDIAGSLLINFSKVFDALASGSRSNLKIAIVAVKSCVDALEQFLTEAETPEITDDKNEIEKAVDNLGIFKR